MFVYTDYSDPKNRSLRIPIDGVVKGYTFKRMNAWIKKWNDPLHTIRKSSIYRRHYVEHYRYLFSCTRTSAARYIIEGLTTCIDLFENIQNNMDPSEKYYKQFTFEAKALFFSYFDFCEPKRKRPAKTEKEEQARALKEWIARYEKQKSKEGITQ